MGREIRRVHPDWLHPRNERGYLQPTFDQCYTDALVEYEQEKEKWMLANPSGVDEYGSTYSECCDDAPDRSYYREQCWTEEEATAYQVYENVSEGTPISPVFKTKWALMRWLLKHLPNKDLARKFLEYGYLFSSEVWSIGFYGDQKE